ncbi:hypothetical protein BKA65DRAFT_526245 [Rhexocercosporidium sp. MPI-PUGE-AT-0058]|nr:hypothetical protein BKA65DRAFT_526245 [Rhexocercosporidium sp. MPI-PUGE-AT-0058]
MAGELAYDPLHQVLVCKRCQTDVKCDLEGQATVVQDIGDSRSERVPWLHDVMGFPYHNKLNADSENAEDPNLVRILVAAEAVLRDAYRLCSDTSPDRKMTQQRANILNEFYAGASGKADGFRYFKNASTLVTYFTTMKQLLVYYCRVVYCESGYFTRVQPDQILPGDAMDEIIDALALEDEEEAELALKHAIRRLYLALICHTVGSVPFKSPVLSFCAMLSRKVRGKGRGLWEEPGNFNSHLSALTWTAQLDDEDQIPTPFGHILQWRLYLFKVGKVAIAKHQARWSLDGQTVEYRGDDLDLEDFGGSWLSHPSNAEFLEAMWCNNARQRHLFIWEKLLMIYVQYHKGQQQSGAYKDNIRFIPKAIGDLVLLYIAYVLPLRQLFLRQQKPGALISPYLWAKLDGTVWVDETLSACLRKACTRAKVPCLHTSNWRQFAASITKEKFSVKERADFDLEESVGEDIEDELDLVSLAEQSNHSYYTFNHAYAGATTLTMSALLHRNYRASDSWRTLFRGYQFFK